MRTAPTILIFIASLLLSANRTQAQTTQPTAWRTNVESFAGAILAADAGQLRSMVADKYVLQDFRRSREGDWAVMLHTLAGAQLVGAHASLYPSLSVAAELAGDIKGAAQIPEHLRARYLPADEIDMKRANATAAQWIESSLEASQGDHVGVIALWIDRTDAPADSVEQGLLFILIKGRQLADGEFRINRIVYGNPLDVR